MEATATTGSNCLARGLNAEGRGEYCAGSRRWAGGLEVANEDLRIVNRARAEDVPQHERGFAESIVMTAQTIVLVLDTEGRIVRFNPYMEESPVARFENRYVYKNGSYKWLEWRATASDEKGVVYAAATDITERKRAEEELQERMDELETVYRTTLGSRGTCY